MFRFQARRGVTAWFAEVALGTVDEVDIGEYHAPDEPELQCYVYTHAARRDVVRIVSCVDLARLLGRLARLRLWHQGAEYRVDAVLTEQRRADAGADPTPAPLPALFRQRFEAEGQAVHVPTAQERHGIDHLAGALLLDALRRRPGD
ncbi:MAG TPA: hypothetical protein PLU22_26260 [Polyangiaceae bacterium]|nr:hypothetical protein [Polyangiaceae bacterium]